MEALKEAVMTMEDFLKKQNVALDTQLDASSVTAHLNRDEFIQILTNLIRNAYQGIDAQTDSSLRSAGRVLITNEVSEQEMIIDVLDNGVGILQEHQGKIFDQGFTTKSPTEGTGLGLAICRRYARGFGGEVNLLYSEPETRGTCFRVTIPIISSQISVAS